MPTPSPLSLVFTSVSHSDVQQRVQYPAGTAACADSIRIYRLVNRSSLEPPVSDLPNFIYLFFFLNNGPLVLGHFF